MENIYETNDSFQFDKLTLLKPLSTSGGNYFMRFAIDGNFLYIQPPKCKTKQGIVKAGKKYYTDLMFSNANDQFIRWMENLETYCQQYIYKSREQWFEGEMEMHDIENYFTSPMKIFKSGTFYIVRTNIPSALGTPTLKIYDEHENEVTMESINENTNVMSIIEIQGIKCSAKSFQIEMEIKQLMVFKPTNLFEKCVFTKPRIPMNEKKIIHSEPIVRRLEEVSMEDETVVTMEPIAQSSEQDVLETQEEALINREEETINTEFNEKEIATDILALDKPLEPSAIKTDIEEIEFNLEQISTEDTVQIKQRNEVYYEMYREARKKAKIAKDLALSSYLEAKRIKNTYMLDDIIDSDDSDLEEEIEAVEDFESKEE
jgi:hypothetical protein